LLCAVCGLALFGVTSIARVSQVTDFTVTLLGPKRPYPHANKADSRRYPPMLDLRRFPDEVDNLHQVPREWSVTILGIHGP
jgi:hypothetical protein